jgi:TATA-binding protein-associated factor
MSRLGLDFLDGVADDDGMDWEKELAADQDMDVDPGPSPTAVKSEPDAELRAPAPVPVSSSFRKLSIVPSTSASPAPPAEAPAAEDEDMSGMSARERNRLKRKRKGGAAAVIVAAPPPPPASNPKFSAMPSSTSNSKCDHHVRQWRTLTLRARVRLVDKRDGSSPSRSSSPPGPPDAAEVPDKVIIDPTKGGAVSPKAAQQSRALDVEPGEWPWQGLVKVLQVDLYNPAWESRHGAAMAMREVLKSQGESGGMRGWCCPLGQQWGRPLTGLQTTSLPKRTISSTNDGATTSSRRSSVSSSSTDSATSYLTRHACHTPAPNRADRIAQVVAPVRETVSQTLASLLIHMPRRSVQQTHRILLQMIRQDFPLPKPAPQAGAPRRGARAQNGREPAHIWEVRHAGLLGIKYEVAVRPDLVSDLAKKADEDAVPGSEKAILQDVVDATILG